MKNQLYLKGLLLIALAAGCFFSGCDKEADVYGTIIIENNASVTITDVIATDDDGKKTMYSDVNLTSGNKKPFTGIPAEKTYKVTVIANNNSVTSTQFNLPADKTKTLSYNGTTLTVK
jgi:hypothetical protein